MLDHHALIHDDFESGFARTVQWYLQHGDWIAGIESGAYQRWIETNYAQREQ